MRRNLGKVGLLWLLMAGNAYAANYQWKVLSAPNTLYVGESGTVRYECRFDTSAGDYTVEMKPVGTERYKASMVTQNDQVREGKRILTFDVLITPEQTGILDVNLNALVRHTTFASIESATIGRDNVKKYDFNDETVRMPAVRIDAKANTAALSGEITMDVKVDKTEAMANEPVHISLYIKGYGNLDTYIPYELDISGVKVYAEPPYKELTLTERGYEGTIRQEFALVAEKSFDIPPFSLSVFDTATHSNKMLVSKPVHVEISAGYQRNNLLDAPDVHDRESIKRYGIYGIFFLLGAVCTETVRRLWKLRPRRRKKQFWDDAKTAKELSVLLALHGGKEYQSVTKELDEGVLTLKEAKKKLDTLTSDKEDRL